MEIGTVSRKTFISSSLHFGQKGGHSGEMGMPRISKMAIIIK
jgi:hypothetical protein